MGFNNFLPANTHRGVRSNRNQQCNKAMSEIEVATELRLGEVCAFTIGLD